MFKVACIALTVSSLTGCASSIGAFYNRPVVEDSLADKISTVSLSADRRTVLVALTSDKPLFCAEPPPDTATGLKTDTDASVKHQQSEVTLKDKLETSVTVLSARNAPLDAFRTGLFTLCQFYMNGALKSEDVRPMFSELLKAFVDTQKMVPEVVKSVAGSEKSGVK